MERSSQGGGDGPDAAAGRMAAAWVARRDRGLTSAEAAALAAWRAEDPRHAAAWERAAAAWRGLDRVGGVAELEAMADGIVAKARARQRRRRVVRGVFAAAGVAAAIAVAALGWRRFGPAEPAAPRPLPENVRVLASTLRTEVLPDGSIAELNGASRIAVEFTATERRVRLVEGEAHFIVERNPARPFFVTAGPVTVRAVGTAFNVRLAAGEIEVLVTEGKVQLGPAPVAATAGASPGAGAKDVPENSAPAADGARRDGGTAEPALVAGQRAVIDRTAGVGKPVAVGDVVRAEIDEALGWQGTRLVFSATPLDEVVSAFNRYNRHRLTLGEARLAERTLTGTFRADNVEGFLRLARQMVDVKAEPRTPTETVLLPAR